jgi:hypothetical protein
MENKDLIVAEQCDNPNQSRLRCKLCGDSWIFATNCAMNKQALNDMFRLAAAAHDHAARHQKESCPLVGCKLIGYHEHKIDGPFSAR